VLQAGEKSTKYYRRKKNLPSVTGGRKIYQVLQAGEKSTMLLQAGEKPT
jgi:hypothetical protein